MLPAEQLHETYEFRKFHRRISVIAFVIFAILAEEAGKRNRKENYYEIQT